MIAARRAASKPRLDRYDMWILLKDALNEIAIAIDRPSTDGFTDSGYCKLLSDDPLAVAEKLEALAAAFPEETP